MPAHEHVVGHLGCGPNIIAAAIEAGSAAGVDASCFTGAAMPEFALQ